ncbi:MAG: FMN-binding protein [Clostridia bacterium]|nr:FMN-binding protein [Clostridia bacterium]
MQENKNGKILFSTLSLLFVSGIIACLVALVNNFTAPVIAQQNKQALQQNIEKIFSGSTDYEDITASVEAVEGVNAVYKVKSSSGGQDNYCVHSSAAGYGGAVELLIGFNCDGQIMGVSVLAADGETPGVGQKIKEQSFLDGFKGLEYDAEGTKLDGVSGATVSSTAAVKAVNNACLVMDKVLSAETSEEVAE